MGAARSRGASGGGSGDGAGLRWVLRVLGLVAVIAGAYTVVAGGDSIPGTGDLGANAESELRFYAVWWIGAGLFLLSLAPRVLERTLQLRVFAALLFLAGVSRILAALDTDWPSAGQVALMAVELTLPVVLVAWQAHATHASRVAQTPR